MSLGLPDGYYSPHQMRMFRDRARLASVPAAPAYTVSARTQETREIPWQYASPVYIPARDMRMTLEESIEAEMKRRMDQLKLQRTTQPAAAAAEGSWLGLLGWR